MHYDLIVVGAGPAGCSAAIHACRAGMRTAIIERRQLPRQKTCGGGVPMAVGSLLEGLDPRSAADCIVTRTRHTWKFGDPILAPMNLEQDHAAVELWCVRRDRFDHELAKAAANMGVDLLEGLTVEWVDVGPDRVSVRAQTRPDAPEWSATASYLVAADGANGRCAPRMGLRPTRLQAIAMETQVPHVWGTGHPDLQPDTVHLEYGVVRNGYVWAFPNSDQLNIGAGVFRSADSVRGADLRATLSRAMRDLAAALGVASDWPETDVRACPLPVWSGRNRLHTDGGRALLAGDAAALVSPLFGDGILNAVRSGRIAAECIAAGRADEYTRRIDSEIGCDLAAAARLAAVFYRLPRECYRVAISRPTATRTAARLLCGELRYSEIAPGALRRLWAAIRARQTA